MALTFVWDVGHGMNNRRRGEHDPGAVAGKHVEFVKARGMAQRLDADMKALGHKSFIVQDLPLADRDDVAGRYLPDLFVSLHFNAAANKKAGGFEVWVDPRASKRAKKFAKLACANVAAASGLKNRGVKVNWWAVLRRNPHDALVEFAFLTNPNDMRLFSKHVDAIERAVLNAALVACGKPATTGRLPRNR